MTGYRPLPTSDPVEQRLRDAWYEADGAERELIGLQLSTHIWNRNETAVAQDRKKHPKAKRNQPVPTLVHENPSRRNLP